MLPLNRALGGLGVAALLWTAGCGNPDTGQPGTSSPTAEPGVTDPPLTSTPSEGTAPEGSASPTPDLTPEGTEPGATDPEGTEPGATDPEGTEPGATDPEGTEPGATDPEGTEPGATDPEGTEPGATDPEGTEPGATDPEGTEPGATDPEGTEPGATDPEDTEPIGSTSTPGVGTPGPTQPGGTHTPTAPPESTSPEQGTPTPEGEPTDPEPTAAPTPVPTEPPTPTPIPDRDNDGYPAGEDCDDTQGGVHPGATELANGVDDDCDGTIDEGTSNFDDDGDGASEADGDCDDTSAVIGPDAAELPDGIDNNCDGTVDEGTNVYDDDDDGFTEAEGDCNDANDNIYPGAAETQDGIDNDCDGKTDEGSGVYDDDGDGVTDNGGDCDDTDPDVYPGNEEEADGKDNDCNGVIDDGTEVYDDDGDGTSEDEGDCDDGSAAVVPGLATCPWQLGGEDCSDLLYRGLSQGSGYYSVQPEDAASAFTVYCDMSTDGGGWTLLGTVSGSDGDRWNVENGIWADASSVGDIKTPFDRDYKSPAWSQMTVAYGEVLWQRRYSGVVRSRAVIPGGAISSTRHFSDLFAARDIAVASLPADIRVLEASSVGVASGEYTEGESSGLGGSGTNGFCWFGEDTNDNVFRGHLHWNQYPGQDCEEGGHLGGVGVYWENHSQFTASDITGTNWLNGTDYTKTDLNLFVRVPPPDDRDGDGYTTEEGDCDDLDHTTHPGTAGCPWDVGGVSCAEILYNKDSLGDGVYLLHPATGSPYEALCDMTTDGGGWTLLGTVSGADGDSWNTEFGYWRDSNPLGSLKTALDRDYKSPAWTAMDVAWGQVLFQRRHDGVTRGQVVLPSKVIGNKASFADQFATRDHSLRAAAGELRVLKSSATGVATSEYAEGANLGLGGAGTNGFCWFGEDTNDNVFRGHLHWNQYPGQDCQEDGHAGGLAVYWENHSQYTPVDVTGTNWLNGVNYSLVAINLWVRPHPADDRDGDGATTGEGDCNDLDPTVYTGTSGCPFDVGGASCKAIDAANLGQGDGVYLIRPTSGSPYEVYCSMSADGGGWTLLGTLSGADTDRWNVEFGVWSDTSTLGALSDPFRADYKSALWATMDITGAEVLIERRYNNKIEGQAVLGTTCLKGKTRFKDLFTTRDQELACAASAIRTVKTSPTGVASSEYAEGKSSGLGGSGTNGFCWFGEDTTDNVFRGHLHWNQYPGSSCKREGHLGGVGLYYENHSQFTASDITGTNWLNGVNYSAVALSIYVR